MSLRITLLRHGKADKTLPDHRLHCLSAEGRLQATDRRAKLGNPVFDLVMYSELLRTQETARLVAGVNAKAARKIEVPELFYKDEDPRAQVLEQAFEKLGHATLQQYYELAREEMRGLAAEAHRALTKEIGCNNATNVLVIGHGVLLQAICIAFVGEDEPFISRVLGECEGYILTMEDGKTTLVETV